jgi:hypothetical protein
MAASVARCLADARREVDGLVHGQDADPLRLELPPDGTGDDGLEPRAAAVLGSLYLLAELEQLEVVAAAELLATQRWELGLRDETATAALEAFAQRSRDWLGAAARGRLYGRLFGAVPPVPVAAAAGGASQLAPPNDVFEELLAGYCDALVTFDPRALPRSARTLRAAGLRLRANLAPRQYGNTLVAAPGLVAQLQAALDVLALPAVGALLGTAGVWNVLGRIHGDGGGDIGRRVDRGRGGRAVVASTGFPPVPDLVDASLVEAADRWLAATGFPSTAGG